MAASKKLASRVSAGESAYGLMIDDSDRLIVLSGGTASNTSLKGTERDDENEVLDKPEPHDSDICRSG